MTFAVLFTTPTPGPLEVLIWNYRRERGSAEDEASAAGQPSDRGCGQRLKFHLPAPRLDFLPVDLIPFEHHHSCDRQPCLLADLEHQLLLPALVLFG